jgi:flavin-dependent dehydrogenase
VTVSLDALPDEADVVVMGSGAAGLVAACRTADVGQRRHRQPGTGHRARSP